MADKFNNNNKLNQNQNKNQEQNKNQNKKTKNCDSKAQDKGINKNNNSWS